MADAVGLIDGEPLLVAAAGAAIGLQARPGLAEVERAIDVIAKTLEQAEIEKISRFVGMQYRVAAEDTGFQHAREGPGRATVGGEAPATLTEVRANVVELAPTDRHLVQVERVNRYRWLVRGVVEDIHALCIDVHLNAGERRELRDHAR